VAENDPGAVSLAAGGDAGNVEKAEQGNQSAPEAPEWLKKLDVDEQTRGKLTRFKTEKDLAKSYLEAERRIGASIVIPGKDASKAELDAFAKRLGRPESSDGYELDPVFLPEGVSEAGGEKVFKDMAFEIGLTKDQARRLYKYATSQAFEGVAAMRKQQEQNKRAAADALRKEYGNEYDGNLAAVQKVNKLFGDDEWVKYLNNGAGNEPALIKFLVKVSKQFSEDTLETGRLASRKETPREPGLLDYGETRPEITGANRYRRLTS
jgi:hypothetical protein